MHWTNKMKLAMELMKEACKERDNCGTCPFTRYCDLLENHDYDYGKPEWAEMLPFNFKIDDAEDK